jgi:hypothetical protein
MKPVYLRGIAEEVEKKLRKTQENKEFKDTGERVKGSKKEKRAYKAIIASNDLSTLEEDEATAIELVVKDRVWIKYDAQAEMDKGVSAGCAFLKHKLRSAYASRPDIRTKEARRAYVGFAEKFQQLLEKCLIVQDVDNLWQFVVQMKTKDVENILFVPEDYSPSERQDFDEIYNNWTIRKNIQKVCGQEFYNLLYGYTNKGTQAIWKKAKYCEGLTEELAQVYLEKWNAFTNEEIKKLQLKISEFRLANLSKLRELRSGWRNVPKDAEGFRNAAISFFLKKIATYETQIDNPPEDQRAHEPDWSWSQASDKKKREYITELFINQGKPLEYIKRTGGLEIETVKEDEIIELFGFRAVEFGNAIRDVEAKEHVRHFLSACSDLFEVLNFDAKTINGLGQLAIAFGSRGSGRASATYYPARRIINITNKRGDGAVAHEWSHYLDNQLYPRLINGGNSNNPFATAHLNNLRSCKTTEALRALMKFIENGDGNYKPILMRFPARSGTTYTISGNTLTEALEEVRIRYDYVFSDKYSNSLRDATRIFGFLAAKFNVAYVELEIKIHRMSAYYYYSNKMGSVYWRDPVELFARAFETYAYDKLIEAKMFNNYLVSGDTFDHSLHVYPYGEEREKLFLLYDKLLNAIREDFNIPDFVPHTEVRTEEYIVLAKDEEKEKVESGIVAVLSLSELLRLEVNLYKVA